MKLKSVDMLEVANEKVETNKSSDDRFNFWGECKMT